MRERAYRIPMWDTGLRKMNIQNFRSAALRMALLGLIGNHVLWVCIQLKNIDAYNALVDAANAPNSPDSADKMIAKGVAGFVTTLTSGGGKETIDWGIALNPISPINDFGNWTLFNHLLFWPGFLCFVAWVFLLFTGRSQQSDGEPYKKLFSGIPWKTDGTVLLRNKSASNTITLTRLKMMMMWRIFRFWPVFFFLCGVRDLAFIGFALFLAIFVALTIYGETAATVLVFSYLAVGIYVSLRANNIRLRQLCSAGWEIDEKS
jgi:hypothetical protein